MRKALFHTSNPNIKPREYYIHRKTNNGYYVRVPLSKYDDDEKNIEAMLNETFFAEWIQPLNSFIKYTS